LPAWSTCFVLLQLPNAGDDLQAIKKGIVEIADLIVFNKADIDERAAAFARGQMKRGADHAAQRQPQLAGRPCSTVSALAKRGIAEFWAEIERYQSDDDHHRRIRREAASGRP
jgi:LAO/AO transport system kinase